MDDIVAAIEKVEGAASDLARLDQEARGQAF
jgi:hypothetical protein